MTVISETSSPGNPYKQKGRLPFTKTWKKKLEQRSGASFGRKLPRTNSTKSKWWKEESVEKLMTQSIPPHLSNMVVVLLWLRSDWLPVELTHRQLLMILLLTEATGWMERYTGAFCLVRFRQMHQNSFDDISAFSRTTVLHIQPMQLRSVKRWNILGLSQSD